MAEASAPAPLVKLETLTYNGPVPYPHPAVTVPTPDEQYEQYLKQQQEREKQREAELAAEREKEKSSGGGLFGKMKLVSRVVASKVSTAGSQFHGTVEQKVRSEIREKEVAKWKQAFPEQSSSAVYVCSYDCKAMHAGAQLSGTLFVSSTHLSFKGPGVCESIPLSSILCLLRCVVLPTVHGGPPYILPVPAEHVIPECLQVYTTSRQIYQFLDFANTATAYSSHLTASIQGTAYERAYNFLDHTWRAATPVPSPSGEYQPPSH